MSLLCSGLSLGSILLAALGLAIPGADATDVVQGLVQHAAPSRSEYDLLFSLPVSFLAAALGAALERSLMLGNMGPNLGQKKEEAQQAGELAGLLLYLRILMSPSGISGQVLRTWRAAPAISAPCYQHRANRAPGAPRGWEPPRTPE